MRLMMMVISGLATAREFTDVQGRKVAGELVAVDAGKATLKVDGGGLVAVELGKFCAADQVYIQEWVAQSVKFNFEVKVTREKMGSTKKRPEDGPLGGLVGSVLKEQEEKWAYKVALRNLARVDATGMVAKFWIFRREDTGKSMTAPVLEVAGSKPLADAKKGATVELVTDPVVLNKAQLQGGFVFVDGSRNSISDKMGGLVLRIYKEGRQIFEYATDEKLKGAAKEGAVVGK